MPTFMLYKDGKKVQGQFYLFYNLFFQKIKTLGVATLDKGLWMLLTFFVKFWF